MHAAIIHVHVQYTKSFCQYHTNILLLLQRLNNRCSTLCESVKTLEEKLLQKTKELNETKDRYTHVHVYVHARIYMYIHVHEKSSDGGPDKPTIPGQCCFKLVRSHQEYVLLVWHTTWLYIHKVNQNAVAVMKECGSEASQLISLFIT